ncbi:MAG: hypothetical protein SXG53_27030 [Pseudomonadota bacterium]|nr:hypothetical protein [Pseudomonadota bacterium]
MNKDNWKKPQPAIGESSGAKGGKDALSSEEQQPAGVEPDSEIDAKLTRKKGARPAGLDPNSIVRN